MSISPWPISPLAEILEHLYEIERLRPNWDSYGSAAPTHVAVNAARDLIHNVCSGSLGEERAVPYAVAPLSGGGVQIEWRGDARAIEVEVRSEGALGYLLIRGREPSREFEEADHIPQSRVLELIRYVVS